MSETLKIVFSNVLTFVAAIVSSYFLFASSQNNAYVEREAVLYDRIKILEEQVAYLTQQMVQKELELAKRYESEEKFRLSLDRMPFPVFVKTEHIIDGKIKLKNWHINTTYRDRFQVTPEHYRGKTDFEIWTHEIANRFYEYDLRVLKFKYGTCKKEIYTRKALLPEGPDNHMMEGMVCKWYDEVQGARAVVGAIIYEHRYVLPEVN